MKKLCSLFLITLVCISCGKKSAELKPGNWRGVLEIDNGHEIPFLVEYKAENIMIFKNAEEQIEVTDIQLKEDSITIVMPVYGSVFKGVFSKDSIYGDYIQPDLDRVIPFKMKHGSIHRFKISGAPTQVITGAWETLFSPKDPSETYIAKGIFDQIGNKVTGTFRTLTGDYRYLEGVMEKDSLKLSTFDGAHAFLFKALVNDSVMSGMFYSGNHFKEPFTATRNEQYELPKADSLTFLKEGVERLAFTFPTPKGAEVSLTDDRFKDKVVIVQIMGTWCPNCLDESRYLSTFYEENKKNDIEVVGLAFENAKTKEKAMNAIVNFKEAAAVSYPILLAQHGTTDKSKASQKLPMLKELISYPTTIIIDKTGKVRKIYTGFNGPATGEEFDRFKKEFSTVVNSLANSSAK